MSDTRSVLIVATHPVQYAAPVYRAYAHRDDLEPTVAFCSLAGAQATFDPGFGVEIEWDVPILEGYPWVEVPNRAPRPDVGTFFGSINPSIWSLIRRRRFDVVVCFGYRSITFWLAYVAARTVGARFIWASEAHNWESRRPRGWKAPLKRAIIPWIYRRADACIAVSTRTVRFLTSIGVRRERIFFTPFVVDTAYFAERAAAADRDAARSARGIPADAFVALQVGRLTPYKRPEDLLAAVAEVPGVHAVIAGSGPLEEALREQATALGIEGRVHFLGFINQSELPEVYALADVLVVPSEWENYPLVVPEAVACGLPVVLTDSCSAAGDVAVDGENAFVVSVADVPALVDRIGRLARDPELRARMAADARDKMVRWTPERHAAAFAAACWDVDPPSPLD